MQYELWNLLEEGFAFPPLAFAAREPFQSFCACSALLPPRRWSVHSPQVTHTMVEGQRDHGHREDAAKMKKCAVCTLLCSD